MNTQAARQRCNCANCSAAATRVYRVLTPSRGFPIVAGSTQVKMFLTFVVCDAHTDALALAQVLTADGAADLISKAFRVARTPLVPDFARASLDTVPLDDPEFVAFQEKRGRMQ